MSGPDQAVAAVRSAVTAELADLPDDALVLVACSGGPDSLALAAATAFVAARSRREDADRPPRALRAGAVVVDHGWHAGSADVAAATAAICGSLGLDPVEVVAAVAPGNAGPPVGTGGPEAAARDLRYAALAAAAQRHGAAAVLLGHTLDDQAETVLLGLARGSGARSLAGMPARRGLLRRPLLGLRRADTVRACAALGLATWTDPANTDPAYTRSRVRAAMATLEESLGAGLPEALARTAALLREDAVALETMADALLAEATCHDGGTRDGDTPDGDTPSGVSLDLAVLAAAPDAVRRRALLAALRAAGCPPGAVGRRHVLAVDTLVTGWRGQGPAHLPGGVVARRDCGRLRIASSPQLRDSTETQE